MQVVCLRCTATGDAEPTPPLCVTFAAQQSLPENVSMSQSLFPLFSDLRSGLRFLQRRSLLSICNTSQPLTRNTAATTMPEPPRYKTLSGEPPNGGIPPGRLFATAAGPPSIPRLLLDNIPPHAPPRYSALPSPIQGRWVPGMRFSFTEITTSMSASSLVPLRMPPILTPIPQALTAPSPQALRSAVSAPPPLLTRPFEPPGQTVDGISLRVDGYSYMFPEKHAAIFFLGDGLRPCDYPGGYPHQFRFSKHKVPCNMTVRELIRRLGAPPGASKGITEMTVLGEDRFGTGVTYTQGEEASTRTLEQAGWTAARNEENPVWLVITP